MNRAEVAECFALVVACYDLDPAPATIEAWHVMLRDLDADEAFAATKALCARDTAFAPRPGEIIAQVRRARGDEPPTLEAATGYFLAGEHTAHPLVEQATSAVTWDRRLAPDQARFQFRAAYLAALDAAERREVIELRADERRELGR